MNKIKHFLNFLTGFRKFTMAVIFLIIALVLLFIHYVTGTEFITTSRDVVVAFMATNVGEHIIKAVREWVKKK